MSYSPARHMYADTFCQDYIITHYVAEFFNTLTSLAYSARHPSPPWNCLPTNTIPQLATESTESTD